jgi:hypothetical protein
MDPLCLCVYVCICSVCVCVYGFLEELAMLSLNFSPNFFLKLTQFFANQGMVTCLTCQDA